MVRFISFSVSFGLFNYHCMVDICQRQDLGKSVNILKLKTQNFFIAVDLESC